MFLRGAIAVLVMLVAAACDDSSGRSEPSGMDAVARLDAGEAGPPPVDAALRRDGGHGDAAGADAARRRDAEPRRDGGQRDAARADGAVRDAVADAEQHVALDARVIDVGPHVDAVVHDAGLVDAQRPTDAESRDAVVSDARPRDAVAVDALPPDAEAALDATVTDAAVVDAEPLPPCQGIVLPPPPDSPDGSEVCNYRDDDGDGLVDEGFRYEFIGQPVRVDAEPLNVPSDFHIVSSGDGFGIGWEGPRAMNFVKVDQRGCPVSHRLEVRANHHQPPYEGTFNVAYAGGRFAMTVTQDRPDGNGIGTFVQIVSNDGQAVGGPIDYDPQSFHAPYGTIATVGDGFGVFSATLPGDGSWSSSYALIDTDGHVVQGPVETFRSDAADGALAVANVLGMIFDGENVGIGLAVEDGIGVEQMGFMRWTPNGQVLTPLSLGQLYGLGYPNTGIVWTGQDYAIGYGGVSMHLALYSPDGRINHDLDLNPARQDRIPMFDLISDGRQMIAHGFFGQVAFNRLSLEGQTVGTIEGEVSHPRGVDISHIEAIATTGGGPFVAVVVELQHSIAQEFVGLVTVGCPEE